MKDGGDKANDRRWYERNIRRAELVYAAHLRKLGNEEQENGELGLGPAAVSRLERRSDMLISTLRRFVGAMGGELEIRARFPDGEVVVDDLGSLASDAAESEELQQA